MDPFEATMTPAERERFMAKKLELIDAQIQMYNRQVVPPSTTLQQPTVAVEEDLEGEVILPPLASPILVLFPGTPKEEILRI